MDVSHPGSRKTRGLGGLGFLSPGDPGEPGKKRCGLLCGFVAGSGLHQMSCQQLWGQVEVRWEQPKLLKT